jgi:hypothetical protein
MSDTGYSYLTNKDLAERLRTMDEAMAPDASDLVEEAATRLEQPPRALSLNEADLINVLMRGVSSNAKLNWYQFGSRDADHPLTMVMRAFTYDGGGFLSDTDDVRDAYVWCSGFVERWFKVSDIIKALDNLDGKHGDTNPIATID